ncbi:uncharacterized protein LOC134215318 [Armigeres subalbatus]|uniref:uncharacterized protein LOC134215318 n=1 Tax=Armigeres subalbatus TaxID=124917 RepID=UPI002ED00952
MEYFAKKSNKRVFHRRQQAIDEAVKTEQPEMTEGVEEDMEGIITELKFIVPSDQSKTHILNLWSKTIKIRNEHRNEGSFLTFLNDFPVASGFGGLLIAQDYKILYPKATEFEEFWNAMQPKILNRYPDVYRFIKNDFLRALAIVRQKNPTRGTKRTREEQQDLHLRKMNPLHGIIQWINPDKSMPILTIPQIIVVGEEFEQGVCYVVWNNVIFETETNVVQAFTILCKLFAVGNVTCAPSDKLFYGFFSAACLRVEKMSTTANKFLDFL